MKLQNRLDPTDCQGKFAPKAYAIYNVVQPIDLPVSQREFLMQHLHFSSALKEMCCTGEAIIEGILNRKRPKDAKHRVIRDKFLRHITSSLRRYIKHELLRSSLEGLMFEQVPFLNEPDEVRFMIDGVPTPLLMTHVYFSRQLWEFCTYDKELVLDTTEDLTEGDIMLILSFFNNHEALLCTIKKFTDEYTGQDRLKWKERLRRNIRSILRIQLHIKKELINMLEQKIAMATHEDAG